MSSTKPAHYITVVRPYIVRERAFLSLSLSLSLCLATRQLGGSYNYDSTAIRYRTTVERPSSRRRIEVKS